MPVIISQSIITRTTYIGYISEFPRFFNSLSMYPQFDDSWFFGIVSPAAVFLNLID